VQFSDASRLLSFYQLWLDDLFPKARFLDALAMVKKALVTARNEWINEGRPKASNYDDDELGIGAVNINDDDLYDATPRGARRFVNMLREDVPAAAPAATANNDMPDDDDLEALMAEAESMDSRRLITARPNPAATASTSTKQNTSTTTASANGPEEDDDDYLNTLIAEAEAQDQQQPTNKTDNVSASADFADEEEAMREMDGLW
jgi:replication fork protection complex subunit Csm3/Swi3